MWKKTIKVKVEITEIENYIRWRKINAVIHNQLQW